MIAQPCPPCMQTIAPRPARASRGRRRRARCCADLPPSSRKTFFTPSAPRRHHAPAGRGRAGEGDHVDARVGGEHLADARGVARRSRCSARPAGGRSARRSSLPRFVALHGVSGAGFSTTVLPAASAGPSFDRLSMSGKFHGVIAPTTPIGSRRTSRCSSAEELVHAELALPLVLVDASMSHCMSSMQRVLLDRVGEHDRRARLGDDRGRSSSCVLAERLLQLAQARLRARAVRGPVGLVEGAPRGGDRATPCRRAPRRRPARSPPRWRGSRFVRRAVGGADELAVDQEPALAGHGHRSLLALSGRLRPEV